MNKVAKAIAETNRSLYCTIHLDILNAWHVIRICILFPLPFKPTLKLSFNRTALLLLWPLLILLGVPVYVVVGDGLYEIVAAHATL